MAISRQYVSADEFSSGLALVELSLNSYGFVAKDGSSKLGALAEAVDFVDGRALIRLAGQDRIECIDTEGKTVWSGPAHGSALTLPGEETTTTVLATPKGWKLFEGENVSLALLNTWRGGKPSEADTQAFIEKAGKLIPGLEGLGVLMTTI
jgi:hypothetical protein